MPNVTRITNNKEIQFTYPRQVTESQSKGAVRGQPGVHDVTVSEPKTITVSTRSTRLFTVTVSEPETVTVSTMSTRLFTVTVYLGVLGCLQS